MEPIQDDRPPENATKTGVRYHFSAARGALRSEDDGRTWEKLTKEQLDADYARILKGRS